jgi:NAD(P)-dependent dehydrogenase (short-subunit alcohol dehydrogenase family)
MGSDVARVAVVTGAASGIGRAVVETLLGADSGLRCALLDANEASLDDFAAGAAARALSIVVDVRDEDQMGTAFQRIVSELGEIDSLVNCAGVQLHKPSLELTGSAWRDVLSVHLDGTFFACRLAAPSMSRKGGGAIVNVSSVAMHFGWPGRLPYAVAKAGIGALTRTLAVEWAHLGIRVNAVAPGYVNTPMVTSGLASGHIDPSIVDLNAQMRFAEPEEIADVIAFLLSERSTYVTGEMVNVDGGFSITKLPMRSVPGVTGPREG